MTLNREMTAVKNFPGVHNHEDDKEKVEGEHFRQKLLKNARKDPTQLLKTAYDNALADAPHMNPKEGSVVASMRRTRAKRMPKTPNKINEGQVSGKWANTISGETFPIGHDKVKGVVCFCIAESFGNTCLL